MCPFDFLFDFLFKKKKKEEERHPLLGRRQGEQGWLEDVARLLKEVISSCDVRGCYPIQMFFAKEIEQAIGQPFDHRRRWYEGTHEDRQIIIKMEVRIYAFNEIATVTQIKHANVAKLLGCCFEMEHPILIYEYVPFILDNRLHEANPSSSSPISWDHRLRIAIEIAYAITYLHIGTSRPIVHRGIDSTNILLDEHNKPKLANFSLSITIPSGETHVETQPRGRMGYLDPAYFKTNFVSEKSDVYSYGVLLLELLSGQRPLDKDRRPLRKFIEKESTEKEMRLELILHNGLSMDVRQVEQAMACMEVALGCTSMNPDKRPEMKEVAQQLEQIERGELPLSSSLLREQQLGKYKDEIDNLIQRDPTIVEKDLNNDPAALALGRDNQGRVRGLGMGVSKTAVHHSTPYRRYEMASQAAIKTAVDELKEQNLQLRERPEEESRERKRMEKRILSCLSQGQMVMQASTDNSSSSQVRRDLPPQDTRSCRLMHLTRKSTCIAYGRVRGFSTEEEECYKVIVDEIIEGSVELIGGGKSFQDLTLGDTIDWPIFRTTFI